jgi:hypothetical protein
MGFNSAFKGNKPVTQNVTLSVNVKSFRASPTRSLIGEMAAEMICPNTDVCIRLSNIRMPEKRLFCAGLKFYCLFELLL